MSELRIETINFLAKDDYPLTGTLFRPVRENGVAVVLHPATGVPRGYYRAFAEHLCRQGFTLLSYDYRGTGNSIAPNLPITATFRDWGELDQPAACAYLRINFPNLALAIIGHSAGGQMLGLDPDIDQARAILLIAAQHGYWRNWSGRQRYLLILMWYVLMPMTTRLLGYFPGQWFGMSPLPTSIAISWGQFCRSPHYVSTEQGHKLQPYNDRLVAPLRLLSFSDDPFAPKRAAERLLTDYYPKALTEHRHLHPHDYGASHIGHFGFFRRSFPSRHWDDVANWLIRAVGA